MTDREEIEKAGGRESLNHWDNFVQVFRAKQRLFSDFDENSLLLHLLQNIQDSTTQAETDILVQYEYI